MPINVIQTNSVPLINERPTATVSDASAADNVTSDVPQDGQLALTTAAKELVSHSAKFVTCRLIYIGANVASRSILGAEDAQHLAASGLINSTQIATLYTTTGAMFIIGVYARGALAARRLPEIGVLYRKGIAMSLCLGVPALVFMRLTGPLFKLTHQPTGVTDIIDQHNRLFCFAVPANIMFMHNIQILSATNNYSAMAAHSILYSALLIPLSYSLMNGYGSLPKLGASGVGLANLIAGWGSVLTTTLYLLSSHSYRPYQLLGTSPAESSIPSVSKLLGKGTAIGLQVGIETFYVVILTAMIGLINQDNLLASVPAWYTTNIITPIIFGLAHVSGVLAKHAVVEERFKDATQYGYASLLVGVLIPITALFLFVAAPRQIISLFIDKKATGDEKIIEQAKIFLLVSTISLIPDAIRNVLSGTLRAYNDTAFAMLSSMSSVTAVGMVASVLLGFKSPLGSLGIFLGRALAFTVGALMMTSYWYRKSHVIVDSVSLNTEQNRSLGNNVQTWINETLFYFFRRGTVAENTQSSEANEEEQPLINRVRTFYGNFSHINPFSGYRRNQWDNNRFNPALNA